MKRIQSSTTVQAGTWRGAALPGFGLSLGYTMAILGLLVLLPLAALVAKAHQLGWSQIAEALTHPRMWSAIRLSLGTALLAAFANLLGGLLVAWTLTRYRFPGRRLLDAAIDLPFALPTAVAGIALTAIYAPHGWLGAPFAALGIKVAFAPPGVVVALVFVGFPFVVRTVQPILEALPAEIEEAAAMLGATRWQTFRRVIAPTLLPGLLTGFALSFARGLGEYGSVVFISGNLPGKTEIAPLLIVTKLEQYDYAGATAIALTLLIISFFCLFGINRLQRWSTRIAGLRQ